MVSLLILLIFISAYFSSTETAMMSLNRFRMKHLKRTDHAGTQRSSQLLESPDRLIGVILIGSNFVNILAASMAASLTISIFAALYPGKVAYPSSYLLLILLKLLYPAVWMATVISNSLISLLGSQPEANDNLQLNKDELHTVVYESTEPYFIPESTPLHTRLFNFQKRKLRMGMVVTEYGSVTEIVTLKDILEETVGEFTTGLATGSRDIHPQEDGSFLMDGGTSIRKINKVLSWQLDTNDAKNLNGLLVETLESIPDSAVCMMLDKYYAEILQVKDNMIRTVKMWIKSVQKVTDPFTDRLTSGNNFFQDFDYQKSAGSNQAYIGINGFRPW